MQPPYGPPSPSSPYAPAPYARPPAPPPGGSRPVLAVLGIGALVGLCGLGMVLRAREVDEFGPLNGVCAGTAAPVARAFVPGQPHRIVGMRMQGGGWTLDTARVPGSVRATELHNTDVVACFGDDAAQTLETCTYAVNYRGRTSEVNHPRTVAQLPLRLVAAATGQTISQGVLQGAMPPACDSQGGNGASANAFHVQGPSVGAADVLAWLQSPAAQLP